MLIQTFCHIPGWGIPKEQWLWKQGILSWEDVPAGVSDMEISTGDQEALERYIDLSRVALRDFDYKFFQSRVNPEQQWRCWPEFQNKCVYLDIETDGGFQGNAVTTIGVYDGKEFRCFVRGKDLKEFPEWFEQYSMVVTFYGTNFDLRILQKAFPQMKFDQIHLDLCFALKRLGYRGGLKSIEKQMGLDRGDELNGLTGLDAIRLWREYQNGRESSLEKLIAYNREDVVNLEHLTQLAYTGLQKQLLAGIPAETAQQVLGRHAGQIAI